MPGAQAVIRQLQDQQAVLVEIVDRWLAAVREASALPPTPRNPEHEPALPAANLLKKPLDFDATAAFPQIFVPEADDEPRARIIDRLENITTQMAGVRHELLARLSELAYEAAVCRVLVTEEDVFDVSAFGVLVAAGLANLFHAAALAKKAGAQPLPPAVLATVTRPLDRALKRLPRLRPGDVWFLDLAARSVRLAAKSSDKEVADVLGKFVPYFVSCSVLNKVSEVERCGAEVAKKANYKLWPGLDTVLSDPGARSLRMVLVGEVARVVSEDRVGLSQGAFFRLLEALLAISEPLLALKARTLLATLLWEMLDQDPKAISRLLQRGKPAAVLRKAIDDVEDAHVAAGPPELDAERRRLGEVIACLRTYDEYNGLLAMRTVQRNLVAGAAAPLVLPGG